MKCESMRHRITLQNPSMVSDGQGGWTTSWPAIATIWANVKEKAASEFSQAHKLTGSIKYDITIRFRSDVDEKTRIVYGARTLNITGVINPDGQKRYLNLICSDRVAT